jgi:hypothetical protein
VLLSQSASPSVVCLSSPRSTYLGFLTEEKDLLLYSSYFPLRVPNGLAIKQQSLPMKNVGVLPSANVELQGASGGAAFWSRDASNGATGQVSPKKLSDKIFFFNAL